MKSAIKRLVQTVLIPLAFLLVVWVCLERAVDSPLILPDPATVLLRSWQLLRTAGFRAQLAATLGRVVSAFAISVLLSVLIGSVQAFVPAAERFLRIPFAFIKAAPVVSFILIALFWFTTGTVPVFVAVIMTMPVVTASVHKGLTSTDTKLLDMCRAYGFTRAQKVLWCYIPSALPVFSAGAVTAFAQTWKVVVAAEVISLPQKALGTAMQTAKVHLETADVFAITLILVTVSFILETVFRKSITVIPKAALVIQHAVPVIPHEDNVIPHKDNVIPNLFRDPNKMLKQVQHDIFAPYKMSLQPMEVRVQNFTSVRSGRTVYQNFTHTFSAGSVTALIAPSGAGKTTLLDYIAGLLPEPVKTSGMHRTVSYIFQEPRLLPALSVVQNIAAPLYRTMGKKAATERALQLLHQVGLSHKAGARVTELSGGEKQRVALARAFAYPAPVLLMDEAFQSQDLNLRLQLLELFEHLQYLDKKGAQRTVIMATHDIKEALSLADTILILRRDTESGITDPTQTLSLTQNRLQDIHNRYLSGNASAEQLILTALTERNS